MTHVRAEGTYSLEDALAYAQNFINEHTPKALGLYRLEIPLLGADPLLWLQHQNDDKKIYWRDRDDAVEMAGLGVADSVQGLHKDQLPQSFAHMQAMLAYADTDVRYYGGMLFDSPKNPQGLWKNFPLFRFVLPRLELLRRDNAFFLACNMVATSVDGFAQEPALLKTMLQNVKPYSGHRAELSLLCVQRKDDPPRAVWTTMIADALKAIETQDLDKVVMARMSSLTCAHDVDPLLVLRRLQDAAQDCFYFCFQWEKGEAFLGASPERLYQRKDRSIWSEALAGTRPRGVTLEDDRMLSIALLSSDKDLREHRFVLDQLARDFHKLCRSYTVNREVSLIKLKRGQHLYSTIRGVLWPDVDDVTLLLALHPTPAIGGTSREAAMDYLRKHEAFDRGCYSGPLGWVSRDGSEFVVAIRSALVKGSAMHVFAGAGIVRGSEPKEEWKEIENKMAHFLDIIHDSYSATIV